MSNRGYKQLKLLVANGCWLMVNTLTLNYLEVLPSVLYLLTSCHQEIPCVYI